MQAIAPAELLQLWETSSGQTLIERSLQLLTKAWPEYSAASLAALSIGERDEMLLSLREYLFGTQLKNTAVCPKCTEIVEWENDTNKMHIQPAYTMAVNSTRRLVKDNISIDYRLPNSDDMLEVTRNPDQFITYPEQLLANCITNIQCDNQPMIFDQLDDTVLVELDEQISRDDPQADIGIILSCPACKEQWEVKFDILSYLWAEIDVWAMQLLHEVYILASAFGWSEADILNMSRQRRIMYVKLIHA